MGDLYVHDRMKKCCASALAKLDKARATGKVAAGVGPSKGGGKGREKGLEQQLSSLTIPKATAAAQSLHDTGSPLLRVEGPAKAVWLGIANKHRARHEAAGETMEALFWQVLAAPLPVLDLSVHPEMAEAFQEMAGGNKRFSAFATSGEKDAKFLDKLKGVTGGKVDFKNGQMLFKLTGKDGGTSTWLGVGKLKTLGGKKAAGVGFHVFFK